MSSKLYMVSLGSGDFELVTIKALRSLKKSDAICVPTKDKNGSFKRSLTYKIVKKLFSEFGFERELVAIYTPMKLDPKDWQRQANIIIDTLRRYNIVSYVTLGDSAIYSSVYYLLEEIKRGDEKIYDRSEVIPGITSFSTASAKIKRPLCLGESKLEIDPLVNKSKFVSRVFMRPKKDEIYRFDDNVTVFENIGFSNERIYEAKDHKCKHYMTLYIDFLKEGYDD